MKALSIATILLFETTPDISLIYALLYIFGLAGMLMKSGLKWWWALVPCYRDFQLSRCAGRENEGRVYYLTSIGMVILNIASLFINVNMEGDTISGKALLLTILILTLTIVRAYYRIRIFVGLIGVYRVRKLWLVLLPLPLAMLLSLRLILS